MVPSARVSDVRTMGRGQARPLQPPQRRPPRPRRRLRPLQPRGRGRGPGRRRGPARGQPLERLGRAARRAARALPARGRRRRRGRVQPASRCVCEDDEWWQRFEAELARDFAATAAARRLGCDQPRRRRIARRGGAARRRWRSPSWSPAAPGCWRSAPTLRGGRRWPVAPRAGPLQRRRRPRRLRPLRRRGARRGSAARRRWPRPDRLRDPRLRQPRELPAGFEHVVLVDPPPSPRPRRCAALARGRRRRAPGFLHAALDGGRARVRARGRRRAARLARGGRRRLPRPARGRRGERGGACAGALAGAGAHPLAARGRGPLLPGARRAGTGRREPSGGAGVGRGRILRGDGSGALGRVPRLQSRPLGGTAIPRKTQTAVEHSELLADLFAVVEEFDSPAGRERQRHRRHRDGGGDDRPGRDRARLRLRLRAPRRPAALLRRRVHHPPGRGRPGLRRDAARHRDALRGAAARHGRGHQRQPRGRPRASSARRSPSWSTASPS